MGLPSLAGFKRWFAYAPDCRGLPIASFHCRVGFAPALCLTTALLDETAKCPESLCPVSVLPLLGRRVRRLLQGHYSSVIAPTDSFANPVRLFFPSALASCKKSSQVATSPCCHRDLPHVISANLSSDAWSLTTAVPRSAFTCFFLRVIGLPQRGLGRLPASIREYDFSRELFSRLQTFLYVQASEFARLPGRSYRCT